MKHLSKLKAAALAGACASVLGGAAHADEFNIPSGDLKGALNIYAKQVGVALIYADDEIRDTRTRGAHGDLSATDALSRILAGTGFAMLREASALAIVRADTVAPARERVRQAEPLRVASAAAGVETVVVTSSKIKGDIQTVPIAITALSQEQLTSRQIAGGPDLVKEVPNLTFTKTNFTGYSIQIRGIGTQAISVTTDPAVAVAFNDIPFIRNHFFEQEFYDVSQVEVVRGPQGTLYGRNATAGVVNLISAKPTDQFEAMLSADWGNYSNRRYEGMVNIPIVDDRLDLRVAGEWTKRNGYTFDQTLGKSVDGRDLWSSRVTVGWKPFENVQTYLVWEHFQENDDRVRSAKQLCEKDPGPTSVDGRDLTNVPLTSGQMSWHIPADFNSQFERTYLSQGCLPVSLYSPNAFQTPNGQVLPFVAAGEFFLGGDSASQTMLNPIDPYASQAQSTNLRDIQSALSPTYGARNDTLEFNADYAVTPELTITSQTGYNNDSLHSTEDFNRFDTAPGLFGEGIRGFTGEPSPIVNGIYTDPQLGPSSAMVGEDLSQEHAWQFSQEVRLASNFSGPLNFSVGANLMHYQTLEDYYVFFNLISAVEQAINGGGPGPAGYTLCGFNRTTIKPLPATFNILGTDTFAEAPSNLACDQGLGIGTYIDPNPIDHLDGQGHNYFRSDNPYRLNSYAGFGEVYYQLLPDLKLTGGLRWTDDQKTFWNIPSQTFLVGGGYPVESVVAQEWKEWTGRFVANWTPKLDFTDQTMLYASYSRGYKGGGANPPPPAFDAFSPATFVTHPPTFAPEFVNAYELGTKNSLLDGSMTLNGDVFYYDYKGYQISQIVDRTSINLNFNAKVQGAELEASYEPIPGLKFNLTGGYEKTRVDNGEKAIDLMDRTAGTPGWVVVRPFFTDTSNCVFPANIVRQMLQAIPGGQLNDGISAACDIAYFQAYSLLPGFGHADKNIFSSNGFVPSTDAPNGGAGFTKDLGGNDLPNAPHFTTSLSADYTMPVSEDWAATLHSDFYWQSQSYARIFNDRPYDKLRGYSNVNLALILTSADGWQVMGYLKNIFDTTAITGAFLNSDDTALTTNVFVTDPRLFGVRVTKNW